MADEKNRVHQLLAVKPDLEKKGEMILKESIVTFEKKAEHFDGLIKPYFPMVEGEDTIPTEEKAIVTTVADKIVYTTESLIKAIDARVSLEESNASSTVEAELRIGDKVFTLSSIALLALEEWLIKIRAMYHAIPTLDPAKVWKKDPQAGPNRYTTEPEVKFRAISKKVPLVLAPATDKHPAQVQVIDEAKTVGKWETTYKSGRITPAQKSDLLERIDTLILAVKDAKAKANQAEVTNVAIGGQIFDFINKGVLAQGISENTWEQQR